ncbi:tyrosine-type recombinase/integrase [Actinobacillus equuli]|uniref:tyrosine-type recombinase/integrase n=1 Tax=Actinobacillus equuli TaxID=718 RepID=UPI0024423E6B|nr:tyrosine-type recombinase/integrase [Actinobacillus equuli]WGE49190.1 tyrosine-type recombinase/integrase [Actinobacillus equuli subsp. equuli]
MARLTKPLTNTEIERAKAKEKEYTLSDGGGLYLLIKPNGAKLWRFNYYKPIIKKRALISFGRYPDISLQQARKQRDECLSLLAVNADPLEHRQQVEREEQAKRENTLLKMVELWHNKRLDDVKHGDIQAETLRKNKLILDRHILPALGHLAITEISPRIVIDALEPAKERGLGDTLKRAIRLLNEVLNFAVNADLIEFNKCLKVSEHFSTPKAVNNPTIPPKELPAFLEALRDGNLSLQTKLLIKWQLLTITRPKEASEALWSEIDWEAKTWTLPAEKMKMKRSHVIPLSNQSLRILEKMRKITGNSPFIFQSEIKPKQPMNSQTANRAIKLLGYEGRLTAHGLRSIASTYLNEQLVNYDVVEACLAHVIKDQTRKAYNRSDYLDQRVEVMQQWADYVEKCSIGI